MTERDERVWKVTLYMTDRQWWELSSWSAPRAAPWLCLEHEQSPEGEYEEKRREAEQSIPEKMVYMVENGSVIFDLPVS